ncbi:hypothetical protein DESUT3_20530 [Desulfuromonas versatilis]|uniref:Diguanylate cyclase/phosphodiesterase with GAF sensor n=1 Tax=Desulfuromonas versatilis TaxID=2802975 RepID=A0ABM8HRS4_9BACT|nr:EAL domain-containing protein [Desulfuromonas versatilis]BCR04984.1 hypothetical protein DESUT3_20530 [Desulfuromonas versatilis]
MGDPAPRFRPPKGKEIAIRITLIYLATAFVILLLFEQLLDAVGPDPEAAQQLQRYLGGLFLAITGALIYYVVRRVVSTLNRGEQVLREIVRSVSAAVGEAFFHTLVEKLCLRLGADHALLGRLDGNNPNLVHVVAAYSRGKWLENFDYSLEGTPCASVLTGHPCYYMKNVRHHFPKDEQLASLGVESYMGVPLFDSAGKAMGLLVVMHGKSLKARQRTESMLQIFALRAAAELERLRNEEAILHMAYYDGLTNLPNERMFHERLQQALQQANRSTGQVAVLFLDLDRFKTLSRTLGHALGERLLIAVVERFQERLPPGGTLARLGDDEFGVILTGVESPEEVAEKARGLLDSLRDPLTFSGQEMYVTVSIGIAIYPHDGLQVEELVKNADAAMSRTKEMGKNSFQFYFPELNQWSMQSLILENKLHQALEREEFVLLYQPQLNLQTGTFDGMEALVCWRHPDRETVSPSDFIPLAEETGLIEPIGEWILRTACWQNMEWQKAGLPPQKVAVNISARQFNQLNIAELVGQVLRETGMEPRWLSIEITESAIMQDVQKTRVTLRRLQEMGVTITIDDFGTGYSSLSYLKQFPIQTLKIDKSFIDDLPEGSDDRGITAAIIAMGHTLGMLVIAEGVENEAQLDFLKGRGCDKVQGYLYSPPLLAENLAEMLARGSEASISAG